MERAKLARLVESLCELQRTIDRKPPLTVVDASALRLQSFYTGIERCFVLIVRVLNGGTPDGADWHRRLVERMAIATDVRPAVLRPIRRGVLANCFGFAMSSAISTPTTWTPSRWSGCWGWRRPSGPR